MSERAVRKTAVEAMADAERAWTQALDEGGQVGDPDELRLTSLLAFGGDHGVTIRRDGTLSPAEAPPPEPRLSEEWATIRFALEGECDHEDPNPEYCAWCAALDAFDRLSAPPDQREGEVEIDGKRWRLREQDAAYLKGDPPPGNVRAWLLPAHPETPAPPPETDLEVDFDVYAEADPLPPFDPTIERTAPETPAPEEA